MKSIFKKYFLYSFTMGLLFLYACKDDSIKYEMSNDIFSPKLVQEPEVKLNTILLVWYDIYHAKDYTIEVSLQKNFKEIFREYKDYENTILLIEDIPYATKFYIRIRANSPIDNKHNSLWLEEIEAATPKRIVNRILSIDKDNDLGKDWAIFKWTKDYESNPIDSIGLVPSQEGIKSIGKKLSTEDLSNGFIHITGLTPNTSYTVNVYNTKEKSIYNQPYNPIRFRTVGDPIDPIKIPAGTDLSAWFNEKNNDPSIPDGVVYLLEAGAEYVLNNKANAEGWDENWDGVTPNKGFTLIGDSKIGLSRPKVYLRHWLSLAGDASIMAFENIDFYGMNSDTGEAGAINYNYLVNFDSEITLELFKIHNCTFTSIGRGLIRTKNDMNKIINNIEITESRFYNMNEGGYSFITFNSPSSDLNDLVANIIIEECTFANTYNNQFINGTGVISLEELYITNCTFYKVAEGAALINIPSAQANIIIENSLFAGETLTNGATIRGYNPSLISATQNYTTTKENMASSPIGAILLMDKEGPINENNLFRNASKYDFTIIDFTSPVYEEYVGDPYWF